MTTERRIRIRAAVRHQVALIARDPGPMLAYLVMGLLLITVTRPMYAVLGRLLPGSAARGIDQSAAGMAVMFSLFALKVAAAHLLNERTWHTWDRLRASPARFGDILTGKAAPIFASILVQQGILFGFSAGVFGLRPRAGWLALLVCSFAWSACVLLLGAGASTLARSPAQLSAAGDVSALLTTVLAGAIVPVVLLPGWLRHIAPASPGYWALDAYRTALTGAPAALARPLAMVVVFGLLGVAVTVLIGLNERRPLVGSGAVRWLVARLHLGRAAD